MEKTILTTLNIEELRELIYEEISKALQNNSSKKNEINYITRKEAASKLRITLPTLGEYTKSGKLKGYQIKGRVLFREDEINESLTAIEPLKYKRI